MRKANKPAKVQHAVAHMPAANIDTGREAVERLRWAAAHAARFLRRAQADPKVRPIERRRLDDEFKMICACIDLLTVNGSWRFEYAAAVDRASRPSPVTFIEDTGDTTAIQILGAKQPK